MEHRIGSPEVAEHRPSSSEVTSHRITSPDIAEHHTTSHLSQSHSTFDRASRNGTETLCCNFCGRPDHFIRQCPDAEEYIRCGRCRRTSEGKIALPTGSYLSRDVPGRFMKFRIDEWHRRNPGYLASNGYMLGIAPNVVDLPRTSRMSSPSHSNITPTVETSNSSLSITNRANEIERELDRLRCSTRIASMTSTHHVSPSDDAQCRSTSRTAPVPSISRYNRSVLSLDIHSHSPAHRANDILCSTRLNHATTLDFTSHIAHRVSDITTSTLHRSNVSCATSDVSSSIPVDLARSFDRSHRHIVPYVSDD